MADEAVDGVIAVVLHQDEVVVKGGSLNLNEQYESEAYPPNTPTYYETTREFDVDAILFSNSSTSAYSSADLEGAQAFCRPVSSAVEAEWPLPLLEHHSSSSGGKGAAAAAPAAAAVSLRLSGQLVSKGTLTEQDVVGVDGEYLPAPTAPPSDVPEAFAREHVPVDVPQHHRPEQSSVLEPVSVDSEDSDTASETNTIVEVVVDVNEEVEEVAVLRGGGS